MPGCRLEDSSDDAYSMLGERFEALSEPTRLKLGLNSRCRIVDPRVFEGATWYAPPSRSVCRAI